jgi:hypothetical protein
VFNMTATICILLLLSPLLCLSINCQASSGVHGGGSIVATTDFPGTKSRSDLVENILTEVC